MFSRDSGGEEDHASNQRESPNRTTFLFCRVFTNGAINVNASYQSARYPARTFSSGIEEGTGWFFLSRAVTVARLTP